MIDAGRGLNIEATSWWRSPERNAQVGGDPYSQHLVGWALDAVGPDVQTFAKRLRVRGFVVVVETDHVHVQVFPRGTLRRLLEGF
jgi:uncharacterized protein YcbK (DUF882 family)